MPVRDNFNAVEALARVRARIARACETHGRSEADVTILAVTKGFGPQAIEAAIAAGLTNIGENYYQEAVAKFRTVQWPAGSARRHFIGRVQKNKALRIAAIFDVVQTVEDLATAHLLDQGAASEGKVLDVLVQLNAAVDSRQGVASDALAGFVMVLGELRNVRVRGLMAMGPRDQTKTAEVFARAAQAFAGLRAASPNVDTLSMGMSDDLELAVACGSTMVRLGTALFGPRPTIEEEL